MIIYCGVILGSYPYMLGFFHRCQIQILVIWKRFYSIKQLSCFFFSKKNCTQSIRTVIFIPNIIYLIFYFSQLIGKLEEKCNLLPSTHKKALSANSDEIMYSIPGDVGIYYDDNGQEDIKLPAQNNVNCDDCGFFF